MAIQKKREPGKQSSILGFFERSAVPGDISMKRKKSVASESSRSPPLPSSKSESPLTPLPSSAVKESTAGTNGISQLASEEVFGTSSPVQTGYQTPDSSDDGTCNKDTDIVMVNDGLPSDSEDELPVAPKKKKKRLARVIAESDGDDETPLEVKETSKSPDITDRSAAFKKWAAGSTSFTPTEKSKGKPAMRSDKQQKQQKRQDNFKEKNQDRYSWLLKVRDIDGHMPDSPAYDPRTLHVPREAFNIFSPFEKQYWQIKKHLWDTVLFFQKGKFYELYENDATIGHQQFDLKMTDRVNMRMVGVPEASIDYWAAQFIAKGYKVAKASQSENQISKDMRQKAFSGKKTDADKVIRRHLECVLTSGTLVDESMLTHETATYCMAIKETVSVDTLLPKFGICFVDTSTGSFKLSFFNDDQDRTGLETLLTQTAPRELVLEKGCISQSTMKLIKSSVSPSTLWNQILPSKEFWDKSTTVSEILKANYFDSEEDKWPAAIRQIIEDSEEAVSATGALIWYLKYLKIDQDILSMKNFERYDPLHQDSTLILDGQTLKNLEIFRNSFDGGSQGTLLRLLDRCITPFGKRLFRSWLCHPLQSITLLSMRLDAVSYLMGENGSFFSDIFDAFSRLPDLERLLSRVHASKCPVKSFVRVIEGFDTVCKGLNQLKSFVENKNSCPQLILQYIKDAPDLNDLVAHWKNAFDMNEAVENGLLIPEIGFDSQFDQSQECVRSIEQDLDALRRNHAKSIKFSNVVFRDLGKEIYQLEVPVSVKVPSNWRQLSATSKVRRYYSPEVERKVRELLEAQETHKDAIRSLEERLYKKFDESYSLWMSALTCISKLDCLQSLATSSRAIGEPSCRPTFVDSTRAVTDFKELRHPYIGGDVTKDIIANDITLGGQHPKLVLLTGANMAGKSTLLRQTCVAVIMAQIGCYVPAQSATLTPFDRIMSRLGANDNIFASQSTFMVELNETKKIITEATPKSLVILDELGRGTSTHDGLAVAYSVLHHLASHCGCVGYFATHYGNLCEEFKSHPEIAEKRMGVLTEPGKREVVFLYKLEDGAAEKSYGLNVAAMARIPAEVIEVAEQAAKRFEEQQQQRCGGPSIHDHVMPLALESDVEWLIDLCQSPLPSNSASKASDERKLDIMVKWLTSIQ